jgi:hypothetical protein
VRKQSAPAASDGPPKPKQSKSRNGAYPSIHSSINMVAPWVEAGLWQDLC